jgi:hypothetical protein
MLLSIPVEKITTPGRVLQTSAKLSLFTCRKNHTLISLKDINKAPDPNGSIVFTIKVEGPDLENNAGHRESLLSQLEKIPKNVQSLQVNEDTPSNTEWSLLGDHFTGIKNLEMDSGWNERLNDENMPSHWPLEQLLIGSACSEVFRSPFIIEGKVGHLILFFTHGLRFEGPTNDELVRADNELIAQGKKEQEYLTVHKGTPAEKKLKLTYIPDLVQEWMVKKYTKQDREPEGDGNHVPSSSCGLQSGLNLEFGSESSQQQINLLPKEVTVHLNKLEILENDAIDTFNRMAIALPHLVDNLSTINIRSTLGGDLHCSDETLFTDFLPQLTELKTLVLSVGDNFIHERSLPTLYQKFPPNLSTLRFRGPVSLARSNQWTSWIDAFSSSDFLPNLKRLSFVLDLHYEVQDRQNREVAGVVNSLVGGPPIKASDEMLREAQEACEMLYGAVERRGVIVEPFHDKWSKRHELLTQVDERWIQKNLN